MSVHFCTVTGHPSNARSDLINVLEHTVNKYDIECLKIGITSDPHQRFDNEYSDYYSGMFVLYETDSLKYVRQMEKFAIDYSRLIDSKKIDNQRAGGAGNYSDPPYYLYIVIKWN